MIPKIVDKSWHDLNLWKNIDEIKTYLSKVRFTPEASDIFRGFSINRHSIRVVIVGLAPYNTILANGKPLATGIPFDVPEGYDRPSLDVIRECLWNDYHDIRSERLDISKWLDEGVFLLNKYLTVTPFGKADSHKDIWSSFTKSVISELDREMNAVVFVFLGKEAAEYKDLVSARNYILEYCHPAATVYAKSRGKVPEHLDFTKSEMFKTIDEITYNIDKTKISSNLNLEWLLIQGFL